MLQLSSNKYYDFFSCNIPFSSTFFQLHIQNILILFLRYFHFILNIGGFFFVPTVTLTFCTERLKFRSNTHLLFILSKWLDGRPNNKTDPETQHTVNVIKLLFFNSVSGGFFWSIKSSSTVSFLKQDFFYRSVWKSWHLMLRSSVHILRSNKTWTPRYVHLTSC